MSRKFLSNLDVSVIRLIGMAPDASSTDPVTALQTGRLYFNTTASALKYYDGGSWQSFGSSSAAVSSVNGLTGGLSLNGTASQISASSSGTTNTLSLPSTVVITTACATNFYGALTGNASTATTATTAGNSASVGGQPASYYAPIASPNFTTGASVGGAALATQTYVTGLGYQTTAGSVSYATTSGSTTQTAFSSLSTTGNMSVGGNLYISGSTTVISGSTTAIIADPIMYMGYNNPANLYDLGMIGSFTPGASTTYQHTGLIRDHTAGLWRLFSGVSVEPTSTVNFASAAYDILANGGLTIYSSSTNISASITAAGVGTFAGLSIGASPVATQGYVTTRGYSSKVVATITGNSSSTSFPLSHNLGTNDIVIEIYQTSAGPDVQYSTVMADIVRTTASVVTVTFASAVATGDTYNVVITG